MRGNGTSILRRAVSGACQAEHHLQHASETAYGVCSGASSSGRGSCTASLTVLCSKSLPHSTFYRTLVTSAGHRLLRAAHQQAGGLLHVQSSSSPLLHLLSTSWRAGTGHPAETLAGLRRCLSEGPVPRQARGGERPPVSLSALLLFLMGGAGVLYGVKHYKEQKLQQVMSQSQQVVGQASVGGPFSLIDQDGKPFTQANLLGEFALLYFGFTHCPDICPDELEKLAEAIDLVDKWTGVKLQPVFISVDPERDTPALVKTYVKDFHPRLLGLTGDLDSVKKASKAYRVYFSKTGDSATDYLVDHSIIHYLINPNGDFVTFYSKSYTADGMARSLVDSMAAWQKEHPQYAAGKALRAPPPATA